MPKEKKEMRIRTLAFIIGLIAILLLWSVDWRVAIGIILFGWCMNLENNKII